VVGGFTDIGYWSSTEYNSSETWFQRFWDINTYQNYDYKIGLGYVRAIRAF
jgi:hypothetical protein